jgi:hypothetical protein
VGRGRKKPARKGLATQGLLDDVNMTNRREGRGQSEGGRGGGVKFDGVPLNRMWEAAGGGEAGVVREESEGGTGDLYRELGWDLGLKAYQRDGGGGGGGAGDGGSGGGRGGGGAAKGAGLRGQAAGES